MENKEGTFNLSEKRKELLSLLVSHLGKTLGNRMLLVIQDQDKEFINKLTPQLFHEIYEEVAMQVGWETNKKCKVKFDDLPETNQETMITTLRLIKEKIFGKELSG